MSLDETEIMGRLETLEREIQDVRDEAVSASDEFDQTRRIADSQYEEEITEAPNPTTRFNVVKSDDTEVRVWIASQYRNGYPADLTTDVGESYKTVTGLSVGPYYLTGTLSVFAANKDPALIPDTLVVTAEAAPPVDDLFNIAFVIAKVTCAAGVITEIDPRWIGDIDDVAIVPDSRTYFPLVDPIVSSFDFNPDGASVHEQEAEIRNASNEADGTGIPQDEWRFPFLEKNSNGTGEVIWAAFDADVGGRELGAQASIQLFHDGTRDVAQIWGFDDADPEAQVFDANELDGDPYYLIGRSSGGPEVYYIDMSEWKARYAETADFVDTSYHNKLDFTDQGDDPRLEAETNIDQDFAYPVLGSSYSDHAFGYGVWFDEIGYAVGTFSNVVPNPPTRRIDLATMDLYNSGENQIFGGDAQELLDGGGLGAWYCDTTFAPKTSGENLGIQTINEWGDVYLEELAGIWFGASVGPIYENVVISDPAGNNVLDWASAELHCYRDFIANQGTEDLGKFPGNEWANIYLSGIVFVDGVPGDDIVDPDNGQDLVASGVTTNVAGWAPLQIRQQIGGVGPPVDLLVLARVI